MPSATYGVIRAAIVNKQNVGATYHGFPRQMTPHTLGTKEGREQTLMYQYAGGSSSGLGPDGTAENWRCMFVDELSSVAAIGGSTHSAPTHGQPQTCVDDVDVEAFYS